MVQSLLSCVTVNLWFVLLTVPSGTRSGAGSPRGAAVRSEALQRGGLQSDCYAILCQVWGRSASLPRHYGEECGESYWLKWKVQWVKRELWWFRLSPAVSMCVEEVLRELQREELNKWNKCYNWIHLDLIETDFVFSCFFLFLYINLILIIRRFCILYFMNIWLCLPLLEMRLAVACRLRSGGVRSRIARFTTDWASVCCHDCREETNTGDTTSSPRLSSTLTCSGLTRPVNCNWLSINLVVELSTANHI